MQTLPSPTTGKRGCYGNWDSILSRWPSRKKRFNWNRTMPILYGKGAWAIPPCNYEESLAAFDRGIRLDPTIAQIYDYKADTLYHMRTSMMHSIPMSMQPNWIHTWLPPTKAKATCTLILAIIRKPWPPMIRPSNWSQITIVYPEARRCLKDSWSA